MKRILLLLSCCFVIAVLGDTAGVETDKRLHSAGKGWRLERAEITDASRPRVLLIGDSILNGYMNEVVRRLSGKAYVDAWVNPYWQSETVNRVVAEVLENGPYDVIHFNMGLHGWPKGRIKDGTYEPLTLEYLTVLRKKCPKATLIWASSTPTTVKGKPNELNPEVNPTIIEHNALAAKIMAAQQIPVNDFYGMLIERRDLISADGIHWKKAAYDILGQAAAESIENRLPKIK
jgi:hypothetical protein